MILIFIILSFSAMAQQTKLRLVSGADSAPLSYAHYHHGNQKGVADAEGHIVVQFIENAPLELTHLSTGYKLIEANELKKALKTGTLQVPIGEGYALQPVQVIAFRAQKPQSDMLRVDYKGGLAHDAGSFLLSTPVVSGVRKSGSYGVDPVLRGFKYDQINVMMDDGLHAAAACPNRMDPPASQIPMNMTENIEILKGPYALRYGSTTGGTIHFRSESPVYSDKLKPLARISGGFESNGNIGRTEAMAGVSNKNLNVRLFGSVSEGGNYLDGNGDTIPSKFYRQSLGLRAAGKIGSKQQITFSATNNRAKDTDFPSLPMDLRKDDTWLMQLRHDYLASGKTLRAVRTQLNASWVDHAMDNLTRKLNPRTMNAVSLAKTTAGGLRSEAEFKAGAAELFAGIDYRYETAEGTRTREILTGPLAGKTFYDNIWQDAFVGRTGLFAEYRRQAGAYLLVGALRLEQLQARAGKVDDKFKQTYSKTDASQMYPSISAGASTALGKHWQAALWLSRAQRGAGIAERYINFLPIGLDANEIVGNPALKPETNHQADIELQFRSSNLLASVSVFGAYLTDFISQVKTNMTPKLPSSPGVRQFQNIEKASMVGTELMLKANLPAGLSLTSQLAYTRGQNLVTDEPLPEIAPLDFRLALQGNYLNNKLTPELSWRSVARQERVSASFGEATTKGFNVLDVAVSYAILSNLNLKVSATNLLNEVYYEHLSRAIRTTNPPSPLYAPGRSFNVYLNYRLN